MLRKQDLAKTVRQPIDASEAKQLLEHLKKWDGNVKKEWKARANANQVAMERGDPFAYADVYKGLSRLEEQESLRSTDREHLNLSLEFLAEEVANALGKTREQVREQIAGA
jgi:RNA polymerase-interacting CarD/CdnL/TRCF family regulator